MKQPSTRRAYKNAKGEKIPGVTTVIGSNLGWSKNGLIQWAHKLGKEGRSLAERDQAADKGTATHALCWEILGHPDGTELDEAERREHEPNARRVVDAILARWTIVHVELALTCDTHAGTIDLVCRDGEGRTLIVDLKTGKGVYDEVAIQLAAYADLFERHHPAQPIHGAAIIHAHPGEPLTIIEVDAAQLEHGSAAFDALLALHVLKGKIKVKP